MERIEITVQELLARYAHGERMFENLELPDGADLRNVTLADAQFDACWFFDALFSRAVLSNVRFLHCNLKCADFFGANLENTVFAGSSIESVTLEGANLTGASFRGAHFYGIDRLQDHSPFDETK